MRHMPSEVTEFHKLQSIFHIRYFSIIFSKKISLDTRTSTSVHLLVNLMLGRLRVLPVTRSTRNHDKLDGSLIRKTTFEF
jgi:hypothetical protein